MRNRWLIPLLLAVLSLSALPTLAQNRVHLLVEQSLYTQLQTEIDQYAADLQREGYSVALTAGSWTSPQDIRALLAADLPNGLVGTVLIGRLPLAQFNLAGDVNDSYWHNFYTLLYYMDLDGQWGGQVNGVFTSHSGNRAPEIWAAVIRADNLPAAGSEVDLLRNYFQRVHQYRRRQLNFPRFRAFQFYHTILPNYANLAAIYSDVLDSGCDSQAGQLRALLENTQGYDFAVINTASGYSVHHFHPLADGWPLPDSYWVTDHGADDVDYRDVLAANPKILFYHLATSETGRFDQPNNLSGTYVFGTDWGLAALAATQHAIIGDTFYEPLAQGKTLGEAFQTDMANFIKTFEANGYSSTVWCPNWGDNTSKERLNQRFYSAILLGDPTLRINRDNRVDNLPPLIDSVKTSQLTQTSVTITWQTDEPADSRVEYGLSTGYGQSSALQSTLTTRHSVSLTGLTPGTLYHFRVLSKDAAGNLATSQDFTFTTPGDATPPVITQITVSGITPTTATIQWQTDEPADTQVEWGQTTGYGQASPLDTAKTTDHRVKLTGLSPNTTYHFRVKSRDASGNLALSSDQTFTTLPDTTPPQISEILVQTPAPTRAVISWKTDEAADAQIEFGTTVGYGQTKSGPAGLRTVHQIELNGLTPNTQYHYRLKSRDAYGNVAVTGDQTFSTPPDTTPPVIQNLRVESIGLHSAEVVWQTDEPADARVQWGPSPQYGNSLADTTRRTLHRLSLTGLQPNTLYHVQVFSRDTFGNERASGDFTFRTLADQEPPVIRQLRIAAVEPGAVTLAWQTHEPATAAVRYGRTPALDSRLASQQPAGLTHQVRVEDLSEGQQYHFSAEATDGSGNTAFSPPMDMIVPAERPDFSLILEAETMRQRLLGQAAAGNAWQMFPGSAVADTVELPFDDSYHFWVVLRADSAAANRKLQCWIDGVLQREFTIFSDQNGYVAFRTFLARGRHEIRLTVPTDASGSVLLDRIEVQSKQARVVEALQVRFVRVDSVSETRAVLRWGTNLPARATVRFGPLGEAMDSVVVQAYATEHTLPLTNLRPATRYGVQLTVVDSLARSVSTEMTEFTTLADRRAPELVEIHALEVGSEFAVVSWRADEPARARIEYGEDESLGRLGAIRSAFRQASADTLFGLTPNTHYFYRIELEDRAGNKRQSPILEFLTHPSPPPGPAAIMLQAETMRVRSGGQLTENGDGWRFTERGQLADSIQITVAGTYTIQVQARGQAVNGQWPLLSLSLDGSPFSQMLVNTNEYQTFAAQLYIMAGRYELSLQFNNPASGANARLLEVDWLQVLPENAQIDREAPQIRLIQIEAVNASTALIRWWTSEPAHGTVEFGHSPHLGRISRERTRSTQLHEIVLSDLSYDVQHFFRIRTWDDHGNVSVSSVQDFVLSEVVSAVEPDRPGAAPVQPNRFQILSHHPNPVRNRSTIRMHFPEAGQLQLKVYDILGREVAEIFKGVVQPGVHDIRWDLNAGNLRSAYQSGVYFLHARYQDRRGRGAVVTRRILLLK